MGQPTQFSEWVWAYLKALFFIILVPVIVAEGVCMVVMSDWGDNRTLVLLPHWLSLAADKRFYQLIKASVASCF
jgi:hypothetical protein